MKKLYVIVRADLPPGAQLAQACHGMRAFAAIHPDLDKEWYSNSNNLVVLQAENETHLYSISDQAFDGEIPYAMFHEPDFSDELTAVSLGYSGRGLVSNLPLALKQDSLTA